jgi:hypothetical protein
VIVLLKSLGWGLYHSGEYLLKDSIPVFTAKRANLDWLWSLSDYCIISTGQEAFVVFSPNEFHKVLENVSSFDELLSHIMNVIASQNAIDAHYKKPAAYFSHWHQTALESSGVIYVFGDIDTDDMRVLIPIYVVRD